MASCRRLATGASRPPRLRPPGQTRTSPNHPPTFRTAPAGSDLQHFFRPPRSHSPDRRELFPSTHPTFRAAPAGSDLQHLFRTLPALPRQTRTLPNHPPPSEPRPQEAISGTCSAPCLHSPDRRELFRSTHHLPSRARRKRSPRLPGSPPSPLHTEAYALIPSEETPHSIFIAVF
jgi:hypothetical protein